MNIKVIVTIMLVLSMFMAGSAESDSKTTQMSSPSLGVGFHGSIVGDQMPTLYTFMVNGESVTMTVLPLNVEGPVIVSPPRVAGTSFTEGDFDDTPKGQRIALWKANHAE